jgi:hypothetical protein
MSYASHPTAEMMHLLYKAAMAVGGKSNDDQEPHAVDVDDPKFQTSGRSSIPCHLSATMTQIFRSYCTPSISGSPTIAGLDEKDWACSTVIIRPGVGGASLPKAEIVVPPRSDILSRTMVLLLRLIAIREAVSLISPPWKG